MSHPEDYPMERGRIVSSEGLDIDVREYDEHFVEEHVERSNALHSRLRERGAYCVGPMARFALNADRLSPRGPRRCSRGRAGPGGVPEPFPQHPRAVRRARPRVRRGAAADRALAAARATRRRRRAPQGDRLRLQRGAARAAVPPLLDRRRRRDPRRHDRAAHVAEPAIIERDLAAFVGHHQHLPDDALTLACEQAIRNYDPCISCATHFLRLEVDRG